MRRALLSFLVCGLVSPLAAQSVPTTVNYQGRLTDNSPSQTPVSATVDMKFEIFDSAAGGSLLWSETPAGGIVVNDGIFNVALGSTTPLPASVFTGATSVRYLQITFNPGTGSQQILAPRQLITSSGYAAVAQKASTADTATSATTAITANTANSATTATTATSATTATTATTATNFTGSLAGDVTGTQGATAVVRLQGQPVSSNLPLASQVLQFTGGQWRPVNPGTAEVDPKVGALTTGYVPRWGTTSLVNSALFENTTRIGLGTTGPVTKLDVLGGAGDAIYGHSNSIGGYLGYETNFSFGNPLQNMNGAGVYAANNAAAYTAMFAQSSGSATSPASIAYSNVWTASYALVDNASNTSNPNASYSQLNITGTTLGGTQAALHAYSNRGTTAGNPGYSVGSLSTANSQNQDSIGVQGSSYSNGSISMGGYFEANNFAGTQIAYAYVGGSTTSGATPRKIVGTGSVSEVVPSKRHGRVTLTAPESPEYWYQDYGSVQLIDGRAHVDLDPILADIAVVDKQNRIRVFCTPVEMPEFNGVTVMNQTATGFDLVELNGGKHSGLLDYQIVVKPKTNHGEGRFPQAPGPRGVKPALEPRAAKAANQPDPAKVFRWPADHEQYGYDPADFTAPGETVIGGPHHGQIKRADGTFETPANNQGIQPPSPMRPAE